MEKDKEREIGWKEEEEKGEGRRWQERQGKGDGKAKVRGMKKKG